MPLPCSCLASCLALRSVPISGNEIVTLVKPRYSVTTLSLRSLRLSAKRQLSRSCYHFIIDVSTAKRSPSTNASSAGLKRSKKTGVWHKCHSLFFADTIKKQGAEGTLYICLRKSEASKCERAIKKIFSIKCLRDLNSPKTNGYTNLRM